MPSLRFVTSEEEDKTSTAWSKKVRPAHIFAFIFETPEPNLIFLGTHEQQFIANTQQ